MPNGLARQQDLRLPLFLTIVVYALAYGFSTTYGYDSITRSLMGWTWLQNPFHIVGPNNVTWVFGPLHCYINALSIVLFGDPNVGPRVFSTLFGILTVIPFFLVVKETFDARAAFYSSLAFPFYSLYAHLSVSANSESLSTFLLVSAVYALVKFVKSGGIGYAVASGVFMSLMSATRYDLWLFIPLAMGYLIFRSFKSRDRRMLVGLGLFSVIALSFPIFWMIGSYRQTGDPLYFINLVREYGAASQAASGFHLKTIAYYLVFFPGVIFLSLTPLVTLIAVLGLYSELRHNLRAHSFITWSVIALVLYFFYVFVVSRQIEPVSRFVVVHGIFLLFYFGYGLQYATKVMSRISFRRLLTATIVVMVAFNLLLASAYKLGGPVAERLIPLAPIVRQPDYVSNTIEILKQKAESESVILLDAQYYEQRVLYLKTFGHWDRIKGYVGSPQGFLDEVKSLNPDYIVISPTNYRLKNVLDQNSDTIIIPGTNISYKRILKEGIYGLYQRTAYAAL